MFFIPYIHIYKYIYIETHNNFFCYIQLYSAGEEYFRSMRSGVKKSLNANSLSSKVFGGLDAKSFVAE